MTDTAPLTPTPSDPQPRRPRGIMRPVLIGAGSALAVLALGVGGFALADGFDSDDDDRIVVTSTNDPAPSASPSNFTGEDCAVTTDDDCVVITQGEYANVTAAALDAVGGGTVIEVDRGDSPGDAAWKVEIRLENGDEAEVRLDENLNPIDIELDNKD